MSSDPLKQYVDRHVKPTAVSEYRRNWFDTKLGYLVVLPIVFVWFVVRLVFVLALTGASLWIIFALLGAVAGFQVR